LTGSRSTTGVLSRGGLTLLCRSSVLGLRGISSTITVVSVSLFKGRGDGLLGEDLRGETQRISGDGDLSLSLFGHAYRISGAGSTTKGRADLERPLDDSGSRLSLTGATRLIYGKRILKGWLLTGDKSRLHSVLRLVLGRSGSRGSIMR
jgi:hypothetical protein